MKTHIKFFLLLILLLDQSCTDVISISEEIISEEILVVEGGITTEPGPYTIKLSTTADVNGLGANTLGFGAQVVIESESGETEQLQEIENGNYISRESGIRGVIGEAYRIRIVLANGSTYESNFERIPEPVTISSLNAELFDERFVDENGSVIRNVGHKISGEFVKETDIDKFFLIEVEGILEVRVIVNGFGCVIDPPLTLCYARRNPLLNQIRIVDDVNVRTERYKADIVSVAAREDQKGKYLAKVIVNSFSPEAYSFWSSLEDQLNKTGSIFDSPIPPLIGNVRNINNNSFAQGYFFASSRSRDQVCFDRSDILIPTNLPFTCTTNCVDIWAPATFSREEISFCD